MTISSKKLKDMDKKYIWHPFTQMKEWNTDKLKVIQKATGSYLYDTDGNKFLDGVSSLWCNVHGHQHPVLDRALRNQIKQVSHSTFLGLSNVPAIELSKELIQIAPKGIKKVFYSDSGSESTEIALKIAFQYWQNKNKPNKKHFVKLNNAYHGDTVGAISVGGIKLFHDIFEPLLFQTYSVEEPHRYRDKFEGSDAKYAQIYADKVEKILKKNHRKIAALIMEPLVQGAAGMIMHPKGYLKLIRKLTRQYNVLLIADEVATGFGRTGTMFACEQEGVAPDILCVAKGLSGGYLPISATMTTDEIYTAFLGSFEKFKAFFHGHTYTANPLACAVSVANIRYFKEFEVLKKAQKKITHLKNSLESIKKLKHVGDVRQCGLMIGIELAKDKSKDKEYAFKNRMGAKVCDRARRYGLIIRPLGNVVVLMPPFSFTLKQIDEMIMATKKSIIDITELQ